MKAAGNAVTVSVLSGRMLLPKSAYWKMNSLSAEAPSTVL